MTVHQLFFFGEITLSVSMLQVFREKHKSITNLLLCHTLNLLNYRCQNLQKSFRVIRESSHHSVNICAVALASLETFCMSTYHSLLLSLWTLRTKSLFNCSWDLPKMASTVWAQSVSTITRQVNIFFNVQGYHNLFWHKILFCVNNVTQDKAKKLF